MPLADQLMIFQKLLWDWAETGDGSTALEALCDALPHAHVHLQETVRTEAGLQVFAIPAHARTDPDHVQRYCEAYGTTASNPGLVAMDRLPYFSLEHFAAHIDPAALIKSPLYHDVWRPSGVWHVGLVRLPLKHGREAWLAVQTETGHEWIGDQERSLVEFFAAGIRRVLLLRRDMIDDSDVHPIVVVFADGRLISCNRRARIMLDEGHPFGCRNGIVVPATGIQVRTRHRAGWNAGEFGSAVTAAALHGTSSLLLADHGISRPVSLLDVTQTMWGRSSHAASIRVLDVRIAQWTEDALRIVYALTRREAELTLALISGYGVAEISARMQITSESVRVYLKSIFSKTGTHHQAGLVALVLSGKHLLV